MKTRTNRSKQATKLGDQRPDFSDSARGQRLQRVMARAGVASRRGCEDLIANGHVTVNQTPIFELPAWVDPEQDLIRVDGQIVYASAPSTSKRVTPEYIYLALHKPREVITTCSDPQGRRCVTDLVQLPRQEAKRMFPVGRLDADSTGLILLTNDGDLAHRLTHPSFKVAKRYHVTVRGQITDQDLEVLRSGLHLTKLRSRELANHKRVDAVTRSGHVAMKRASMADVRRIGLMKGGNGEARTKLMVTLTQGQNRQIRRMLAKLGYKVGRLKRIALGPVSLNRLSPGQWRQLERREVTALKQAVGLKG